MQPNGDLCICNYHNTVLMLISLDDNLFKPCHKNSSFSLFGDSLCSVDWENEQGEFASA